MAALRRHPASPLPADATLISAAQRFALGTEPVIVRAGPVVLDLADVPAAGAARLDGGPLPLAFDALTKRGTAAVEEKASPGPYLEMFARRARFGWDYWGDQSLGTAEGRA